MSGLSGAAADAELYLPKGRVKAIARQVLPEEAVIDEEALGACSCPGPAGADMQIRVRPVPPSHRQRARFPQTPSKSVCRSLLRSLRARLPTQRRLRRRAAAWTGLA